MIQVERINYVSAHFHERSEEVVHMVIKYFRLMNWTKKKKSEIPIVPVRVIWLHDLSLSIDQRIQSGAHVAKRKRLLQQ